MRLRALPWMVLFEVVMLARDRWGRLEADERRRLNALVAGVARERRTPTRSERELLRSVVAKLDLVGAGRDVVPRVIGRTRGRRR
jgi:hypothetical protein